MNERIQELAEQAKKYSLDAMIKIADKEQALKVYSESYDTKFAELIVRECMDVCYRTDTEYEGHKVKSTVIASKVAEHFGVEE
jgi:hypothetical protein